MAILSTGPIDNSITMGNNLTQIITVKIVNTDSVNPSTVEIQGYYLDGTRTLYVSELFSVAPNQVVTKDYDGNFTAYEFVFMTGGSGAAQTEISVWGKTALGTLVDSHRVVAEEQLMSNEII